MQPSGNHDDSIPADSSPVDGSSADSPSADDPRPQEPEKPLASDCCESGCPICVYDLYAEQLQHYRQQLAAWKSRRAAAARWTPLQ